MEATTTVGLTYDPKAQLALSARDIEYRRDGDTVLMARIYQPQAAGPFPAMIAVHGGAWANKEWLQNEPSHQRLAEGGLVVMAIQFRTSQDGPHPLALRDINYAIRWLKAHAADFNADAATVGGLGVSSGGHLILLSAMRPDDPRYTVLPLAEGPGLDATLAYAISCWGVLDPYGRYELARAAGNADLMANHERYFLTVETQKEANPLMILQRGETVALPPALLIQGTADVGVPQGMVEEVARLYNAAGGDCELALFEGMPHGIAGWPAPEVERMVERMTSFIARRLSAPVAAS
jgi:acetyl esterase/lipase